MKNQLWKTICNLWGKETKKTDEETLRAVVCDGDTVLGMLDGPGWEVLRAYLSKRMLDEIDLLRRQMQAGKVPPETLPMRLVSIFTPVQLVKEIEELIADRHLAEMKLKKTQEDRKD